MFEGASIKETLTDELFLDLLTIEKAEVWKTDDPDIRYWTMVFFKSEAENLPQRLAEVLIDGWFADMKQDQIKYIIFKNGVYRYTIGNADEKNQVLCEMRKRGIPDKQFHWEE